MPLNLLDEFLPPPRLHIKLHRNISQVCDQFLRSFITVHPRQGPIGAKILSIRRGLENAFDGILKDLAIVGLGDTGGVFSALSLAYFARKLGRPDANLLFHRELLAKRAANIPGQQARDDNSRPESWPRVPSNGPDDELFGRMQRHDPSLPGHVYRFRRLEIFGQRPARSADGSAARSPAEASVKRNSRPSPSSPPPDAPSRSSTPNTAEQYPTGSAAAAMPGGLWTAT